jgi:hypothetical protein
LIGEYFSKVNAALIISPVINSFSIKREIKKELEGYIRIDAVLKNNDQLEIFLYVTVNENIKIEKYRVHWQDKNGKLIRRWDNAPHHRKIETFPHHIHKDGNVYPHKPIGIIHLIEYLEKEIK